MISSLLLALLAPLGFKPAGQKSTPEKREPAEVGSIDDVIAWLETKDPFESYDWNSFDDCLFAQYGTARGLNRCSFLHAMDSMAAVNGLGVTQAFAGHVAARGPQYFGSALKRARAFRYAIAKIA